MRRINRKVLSIALDCIIPVIVMWVLVNVVFLFGRTVTGSMEPTLMTGSYHIANRMFYNNIKRGDIILFKPSKTQTIVSGDNSSNHALYGKRVIGLPGETITFKDGRVFIDGKLAVEEYIKADIKTNSSISYFVVPEGEYFVMGDNREHSRDSRGWDYPFVKEDDIVAKIIATFNLPW